MGFTIQRRKSVVVWRKSDSRKPRTTKLAVYNRITLLSGCFSLLQTVFISFRLTNMACGATLKRSMEFEALLSPQSPKRRRCNPLPGTPSTPSPQRCNLRPPVDSPTHSMSPSAIGGEHRLTPGIELRRIFLIFSSFRVGIMGEGVWVEWNGELAS